MDKYIKAKIAGKYPYFEAVIEEVRIFSQTVRTVYPIPNKVDQYFLKRNDYDYVIGEIMWDSIPEPKKSSNPKEEQAYSRRYYFILKHPISTEYQISESPEPTQLTPQSPSSPTEQLADALKEFANWMDNLPYFMANGQQCKVNGTGMLQEYKSSLEIKNNSI